MYQELEMTIQMFCRDDFSRAMILLQDLGMSEGCFCSPSDVPLNNSWKQKGIHGCLVALLFILSNKDRNSPFTLLHNICN